MIPLSARETMRHEVDGIAYIIAVPTKFSRAAFYRAMAELGATYPNDKLWYERIIEGINTIVAEDQRGKLIESVDAFEFERKRLNGDDPGEEFRELAAQVEQIEDFLRTHFPRYAQIEAQRGYWLQMAPLIAFSQYVIGWDSQQGQFRRAGDRIPEGDIERVPDAHVWEVGTKAMLLMRPSGDQEKNSESQSSLPADPEPSTAEPHPPMAARAGKSAGKSTRRIRH